MVELRGSITSDQSGEHGQDAGSPESVQAAAPDEGRLIETTVPIIAGPVALENGAAPLFLAEANVRTKAANGTRSRRKPTGEDNAEQLVAAEDESADAQPAENPETPADPANGETQSSTDDNSESGGGGGGDPTLLIAGAGVLAGGLIVAATGGGGGGGPPANRSPVAAADSYSTNEDTALVVAAPGVLANDSDTEGNALSAALVTGPANGTLTLNANGSFTYTPNANYNGADSFTYKANDGTSDGNTVTVSLTINPVNDAPVAVANSYSTTEDTALVVAAPGVLGNDTDIDGNPLTAALVTGPANGTLTLNANGSFTYSPNANYNGADSFTYKVNDGTVDGNTVTVSLTVNAVNDAPVAVADSYSTSEDTALVVAAAGVLANDSDVEGSALTAALVAGPANGTLTLNANGSFTYTPNANYNGADSFTYRANDGTVDGNTVTVSLTVNPVNDAPVAVANSYSTNEDTALVIAAPGVLGNDTDIDGNPLTAALVTGPANGTLTLNANGSFTYTPNANYNGADSFTYRANDGTVNGNTVTVSLTVNPVNDAPVAVANSYSTNEDTALVVAAPGVLGNDTDIDGNPLTAVLVAGPANGTLTLNADGSFTYTPNADFSGADSFTYRANDGTSDGNTVTVSLTVNAVNDTPVAVADSYSTNEDSALVVAAAGVLANDTDIDGDVLTAVLVTGPANGTLTLNADGSFTYTPNVNYNGADSFTYKVNDGTVDGNTVTVSLTVDVVNDAPVAVADSYSTNEDTALVVAAAGVLTNDSDVEGSALTAVLVAGPANGTLTLNADGSFTYTPNADFSGADSFTYRANDGTANGNTVTVSLTVNPVNDAPVAVADSYFTNEDTPLVVAAAGVLANDTDLDGNPLTAVLVTGPANGTLTLNADGSFTYTPNVNYNGADSFTYKVNDGTVDGNTVTVSLTVNAVNDAPVAVADSYTTNEDTTLTVAAPGLLANDSDVEGNPMFAQLVSGPTNGVLVPDPGPPGTPINGNGSFTYTPNANFNGTDSFTYKVSDGAESNTVTVTLTVNAVSDAPVAVADNYSTNEDTPLVVAAAGVLANDSDADGNPLTAVLVTGPANGTLTLNADGSFTYTPNVNYNGSDSFTYKVNDGTVDGNTVTVSLTVNPVNDAPVAVADNYSTNEDTTLNVTAPGVLANDSDVEGSSLFPILVSGPTNGVLNQIVPGFLIVPDGSFSYTPNANFSGTDSFTYKLNDGTVEGNTVTVTLTVNAVNDAPVAVADSYSTNEDTALVVAAAGVLANDSDVEGSALTAVLVTGPANGTLTLNSNGSFTYTPNANYSGAESFTYKVNDGTVDGNTVTVSLTVNAVNDVPVAVADSYSTNEDTALVVAAAGVLTNDSDVEGSALTAVLVTGPANGTLTLNADGSFTYTPNANYNGADSFTYKVNDGTVDGNTVTVSLTVNAVNDAPVAVADNYSTNEDTVLNVAAAGVLANDSDVDGNPLTAVLVTGPANGTLTLNANGSFDYTPNANYNGADSFTYKVNDGTVDGNTVTVSLTVNAVNDAPVAVADSYSTVQDTPLVVAAAGVLANDSDADGNALSSILVSNVANGTLTLNADGSFTYTPNSGYLGADSFTYKVNDGTVDGNTVTVSLSVNSPNASPVAVADAYSTNEDTPLVVAAAGVLANDTDAETDPLTAVLVTGPANGTLTLNADGSFTYTPNANYNGADSFTYKANDGTSDGNTVTVSLTINAVNDAPTAVTDSYSVNEDATLNVAAAGVLGNDTDPEGNSLTAVLVTGPANASAFTLNADGSFDYTPNANFSGSDSFTYKANDGTVDGNTVTVNLTVNPLNDAPVTVADSYSTNEDTALNIAAAGVLANDTDPDGNALTAVLVSGPANGTLTLNANGSFDYTPNANYNGADSFTYKANDGTVDGNTVTVNLTVNPGNDPPVANDDVGTAPEDTALTVNAASGVLSNDTDIDGNTLTVSAVTGGTVGVQFALGSGALLTLNADGSYVYNPNGQFEVLRPGETDTDTFTYTASDGSLTDTATVTITIQGANEAPIAVDDAFGMTGNTPITFTAADLLGNDSDPDQPAAGLSIQSVSGGVNGTAVLNGDGTVTFTPTTGFSGAASFNYTLADADGGTDVGTVNLTVADPVWYVNNAVGSDLSGDGSYANPFATLAPLSTGGSSDALDNADDTIFVYNAGTYANESIVLEAGQKLYGDGHALTVNGLSIGANATNTTLGHAGTAVTLSTNNTVMGLTLNGTANAAIGVDDGGNNVGTFTMDEASITGSGKALDIDQGGTLAVDLDVLSSSSSITEGIHLQGVSGTFNAATGAIQTSTGTGVLIGASGGGTASSGGAVAFTYGGDITNPGGSLVEIQDRTGGTVTFNGNLTEGTINAGQTGILIDGSAGTIAFNGQTFVSAGAGTGNGVTLTNNTATINFTPAGTGLDITTTSGSGLTFTGGGTLNLTGAANSVTTTTGQVLNLANGTMGTSGIAFQTLQSGTVATGNAININNLDAAGGGTFSGGAVTIGGTGGASADGINITSSNSTFSFASATIDNTAGDGIEINGQTQTQGAVTFTTVNLDGMAGAGISIAGATNAVNVNGGTIGATNDPAGDGVNVTGGTGAVTVAASVTQSSGGNNVVDISSHATGAISFTGAITTAVGGGGIRLVNNSSGNIDFSGNVTLNTSTLDALTFTNTGATGANVTFSEGSIDIDTTSGTGINATNTTIGAGSLTISGATGVGNIVSSTTGRAININGVTSNITLNEVNVSGGGTTTGVFLQNTGAGGQFVVTGDSSTAGSGGTIANIGGADVGNITGAATTGTGIYMNNVANVSLSNMTFSGTFNNFGIRGDNVNNFTLRDSSLTGSYGGNNSFDEGTIRFGSQNGADGGSGTTGLKGTALFDGNTISGGNEDNLAVYVYGSDTLNLTVKDSANDPAVFGLNNTTNGNDEFFLESGGTSNVTVTVTGVEFQGARGDMLQVVAAGSTTQTIAIQNNTFINAHTNIISGGGGIAITGSGTNYNVDYLVNNNTFKGQRASAIFSSYGGVSGTISGLVTNNTQGTANGVYDTTQANRGSMEGMFFFGGIDSKTNTAGNINYALRIEGNTIRDVNGAAGILLRSNQQGTSGQARLEATIANNTMAEFGPSPAAGVYLQPGGADLTNDKGTIGLNMSNNTINFSVGGTVGDAVAFDQASTLATFYMPGYTSAPSANGNTLASFLTGTKGNTFTNAAASGTGGVLSNTSAVQNQAFVLTVPTALAPGFSGGWEDAATVSIITLAELNVLVEAAIQRWSDAGATAAQIEAMRNVSFDIVDLEGVQVGIAAPGAISIDRDGAGYGWFVDPTPGDDSEFVDGIATADGGAAGKLDALTVVMHELGHQIGLDDSYASAGEDELMHGYMAPGERHVPTATEVAAATVEYTVAAGDLEQLSATTRDLARYFHEELHGISLAGDAPGSLHSGDLALTKARAIDLELDGAPDWAGLATALDFGASLSLDSLLGRQGDADGFDAPAFADLATGPIHFVNAIDPQQNIFGESDYRVL